MHAGPRYADAAQIISAAFHARQGEGALFVTVMGKNYVRENTK